MQEKNLKKDPPGTRTHEQLRNHYEVERGLANKLLSAPRHERREILLTMYDELFAKVPDHPRLTRRESEEDTALNIKYKYILLEEHLSPSAVLLEFAPGDCKFAYEACKKAKFVYGIDISDQRSDSDIPPENFKHIVFDGYSVDISENTIDVAFSDQLLEHLHPDDIEDHFRLALKVLKPGGVYLFRTPHSYSGPHDISAYFSDVPKGFHLKEYTFEELFELLKGLSFSSFSGCLLLKGKKLVLPHYVLTALERFVCILPKGVKKAISKRILREVTVIAVK